jgi:hypothetical protein
MKLQAGASKLEFALKDIFSWHPDLFSSPLTSQILSKITYCTPFFFTLDTKFQVKQLPKRWEKTLYTTMSTRNP